MLGDATEGWCSSSFVRTDTKGTKIRVESSVELDDIIVNNSAAVAEDMTAPVVTRVYLYVVVAQICSAQQVQQGRSSHTLSQGFVDCLVKLKFKLEVFKIIRVIRGD